VLLPTNIGAESFAKWKIGAALRILNHLLSTIRTIGFVFILFPLRWKQRLKEAVTQKEKERKEKKFNHLVITSPVAKSLYFQCEGASPVVSACRLRRLGAEEQELVRPAAKGQIAVPLNVDVEPQGHFQ
jgi:hypothetical protein